MQVADLDRTRKPAVAACLAEPVAAQFRVPDDGRVQALALVDQASCDTRNWPDAAYDGAQCNVWAFTL